MQGGVIRFLKIPACLPWGHSFLCNVFVCVFNKWLFISSQSAASDGKSTHLRVDHLVGKVIINQYSLFISLFSIYYFVQICSLKVYILPDMKSFVGSEDFVLKVIVGMRYPTEALHYGLRYNEIPLNEL